MTTKYGFDCNLDESRKRMTNQIWKLIPLWEENADWEKQLNSVIIEIAGRNVFESITMFNDLYHE